MNVRKVFSQMSLRSLQIFTHMLHPRFPGTRRNRFIIAINLEIMHGRDIEGFVSIKPTNPNFCCQNLTSFWYSVFDRLSLYSTIVNCKFLFYISRKRFERFSVIENPSLIET